MTSVDELFKKPNGTSSIISAKRKLEIPDGDAAYKAAKLSAAGDVKSFHQATAADEYEEEDDDFEAGPSLPPEDEDENTDEEGRFFGSGVTRDTREAMDYLEKTDDAAFIDERIDAAWTRRLVTNLERKVAKNAEQRARHEDEPAKFMASEADLDAEIKHLSLLTEHGEFYATFAEVGGAEHLVGLLAHDNTDIAINAIEIIGELLDEDVDVEQEQWDVLAGMMLEADLISLLYQNLQRLDEKDNQSDAQGVYHSLAILEALASQVNLVERAGSKEVLQYLLGRMQSKEVEVTQNKQYAAEVLQVLSQESSTIRKRVVEQGGVGAILQLLSAYRRKDPEASSLEEEYMMNLFNSLVCLVQTDEGKAAFVEEEGVELMLIMAREGKTSKEEALKVLDHATQNRGQKVCIRIVEAAGLKSIFGLFRKKLDQRGIESLVDVLAALLRYLPGDSPERIRTLGKFSEKQHEKVDKLLEWRAKFLAEVVKVDRTIAQERKGLSIEEQSSRADEWFLRRLDAGASVLQTINIIVAWLVAEDPETLTAIGPALSKQGASLTEIAKSLRTQITEVDATVDEDFADMLKALVDAIQF